MTPADPSLALRSEGADVVIAVHVRPRAARDAIVGVHGDALDVRVRAAPTDGRANDAVRDLLAETVGIARSRVELMTGGRSRIKRFRLRGLSVATAERRLMPSLGGAGAPPAVT